MTLKPLFPATTTLGINTDLYELTMAAAFFEAGRTEQRVTFELFTRRLPKNRSYLLAAGLEQALHYVLNVAFTDETIAYLRQLPNFRAIGPAFFDYLRRFRFTGDVWAIPEGTVFFENEPILQITAPIIEAQILETFLINALNFQTIVASKASRICLSARGRQVVDFGTRRAHSPQAGLLAARASFIGGCQGTSNVLAGFEMGIPVVGTMAHSFVQLFDSESEAFREYQSRFPDHTILLVDTYDTLKGVEAALQVGGKINGIRLDSGDVAELARSARSLLDRAGRNDIKIFASGNLDEERIHSLVLDDAPIDAFGVGTEMVISGDAPSSDMVYKLVEIFEAGRALPKMKTSQDKMTTPHRKQIFRKLTGDGFAGDLVGRWDEDSADEPLLRQMVKEGKLCVDPPGIQVIQRQASRQLALLPTQYKLLHSAEVYPVEFSDGLRKARRDFIANRG
jgi:nicotinate phosphoribosyltransferase